LIISEDIVKFHTKNRVKPLKSVLEPTGSGSAKGEEKRDETLYFWGKDLHFLLVKQTPSIV
jgi:hypothetical protein